MNRTQAGMAHLNVERRTQVKWTGLSILSVDKGGHQHNVGMVEFEARYTENGHEKRLIERSAFKRIKGKWFYVGAERA